MAVKYIGTSTVRVITREQWEAAGVKDQDTVVWDKGSGYAVNDDQLNDNALSVLARDDAMISVGDVNDLSEDLEARIALARGRMLTRAANARTEPVEASDGAQVPAPAVRPPGQDDE